MRAFVTGACGFAGGHLIEHLRLSGDQVLGGVLPQIKPPPEGWTFDAIPLDIRDGEACARVIAEFKPEVVYHLAGLAFVPDSEVDFDRALLINVSGTYNICRVCHFLQSGVRVVLISSSEVYGKVLPDELPVTEQSALRPANNYSLTKLMAEMVGSRFSLNHNMKAVVVRPFNHIGPRQDRRFVTSSFALQLALIAAGRAEPRIQVGNLTAQRDFTDVRDMVKAYRLAAVKGDGVYTFGSGRSVSIQEVLDALIRISGLNVSVEQDPARMRPSEVANLYGSNGKAERELGWKPEIGLETTLRDIYLYWLNEVKTNPEIRG